MAPARPMSAAAAPSSWDRQRSAHAAFSRAAGDAADLSACTSGRIAPASTMIALFSSQIDRLSSAVTPCSCSSGSACDSNATSGRTAPAAELRIRLSGLCPVAVKIQEIPEDNTAGCVAIKKAFAMGNGKGKRKELSPQDAALLIQLTYRAHLARRSQVLRCLRELAVAKAKLKEIRSLFYNISYRHRIAHDHEERQKFSEKIIVLLLTVDALEGMD